MTNRLFIITAFLMAICAMVASAGEIVEVRVFETQSVNSSVATAIPKDAKMLVSLDTKADAGGDFLTRLALGEKTILLEGNLKAVSDGKYNVKFNYSQRDDFSVQSVSNRIEVVADEQKVVSGMLQGNGSQLIVLQIKQDPKK